MVKIKRNKRRKRYQYKNKKRINNAGSKRVKCLTVDKEWNQRRTTKRNYKELGLAYDLNNISGTNSEEIQPVTAVVEELEKNATALRSEKSYRLPKNQVEYLTYLLDTYGEDYKAMTRDKKNHLQLTWKQFRSKVNAFKNIPEQFNKYLDLRKSAGLPDLVGLSMEDDADLF